MLEKRRWILARFEGKRFAREEAKHCVYDAVLGFLGTRGVGEACIKFAGFNEPRQEAIVGCATSELEKVIAALALQRRWRNEDVAIRALKVSGTIKALKAKRIKRA